jgi:hypothetical protein
MSGEQNFCMTGEPGQYLISPGYTYLIIQNNLEIDSLGYQSVVMDTCDYFLWGLFKDKGPG